MFKSVAKIATTGILSSLLFACSIAKHEQSALKAAPKTVKFASFNVSFAHDGDPSEDFAQWIEFMNIPVAQQDLLIEGWRTKNLNEEDHGLAERIIQIRNIAAIIQIVRPDVLLLNEFNNDGYGENYQALKGFQANYLSVSQNLDSVDGGEKLTPISYPYVANYATNTGLPAEMDLANDGYSATDPNDAYGFGFYHGHYAFALMSKYEIDTANTRTFQTFKRKDLPQTINPTINVCDGSRQIPESMQCGDNWFSDDEWQAIRLSSKNHVDAPILIPGVDDDKVINALLAHPTPPGFDTVTDNNKYRNSAENQFWRYYIDGYAGIYDDNGQFGGFSGNSFVIMGDLNADTVWGRTTDSRFNGIQQLLNQPYIHPDVIRVEGDFLPTSTGATEEPNRRDHPFPPMRTATFGSKADYAVPSADLTVVETGVYWPAEGEPGRLLMNDTRIGKRGTDKEVSSDHRLVWVTIAL